MIADPETPAQPPSPSRKTRPSEQELSRLIEQHRLWLASEGGEGARAFVGPLDLSGMDLRGADLQVNRGSLLRSVPMAGGPASIAAGCRARPRGRPAR